jgi:hypothetical protein
MRPLDHFQTDLIQSIMVGLAEDEVIVLKKALFIMKSSLQEIKSIPEVR